MKGMMKKKQNAKALFSSSKAQIKNYFSERQPASKIQRRRRSKLTK
jgi:hypothetical protein